MARLLFCVVLSASLAGQTQEPVQPTFKASVALVPMTAVVRDSRNRLVQDLGRDDFQVFENGRPRAIVDFNATEHGPVSVALLFDTSGSMRIGSNLENGKGVVDHLLSWLEPARDEVALFTFDRAIRRETPFTANGDQVRTALRGLAPTGVTSLYDAMAEAAKQIGGRGARRRALVVITDRGRHEQYADGSRSVRCGQCDRGAGLCHGGGVSPRSSWQRRSRRARFRRTRRSLEPGLLDRRESQICQRGCARQRRQP